MFKAALRLWDRNDTLVQQHCPSMVTGMGAKYGMAAYKCAPSPSPPTPPLSRRYIPDDQKRVRS